MAKSTAADLATGWDLSQDYGGHWLTRDLVDPDFYYTRNEHRSFPLTPIYADFGLVGSFATGSRSASEAFAVPGGRNVSVVIDGYQYGGRPSHPEPVPAEAWEALEKLAATHSAREVLRRWWEEDRPDSMRRLRDLQQIEPATLSDGALLAHMLTVNALVTTLWERHFVHLRGVEGPTIIPFVSFCRTHFDLNDLEILDLLAGASPASSDATVRMEQVAAAIRAQPALLTKLESPRAAADPDIGELLAPFLEDFGSRVPEMEYVFPTLNEQPEETIRLLREAVKRLDAQRTSTPEFTRQQAMAMADELAGRLMADAERAEFATLLEKARAGYGPRDDTVNHCMWGDGLMRGALLEAGRRLVERGAMPRAELVLFLFRSELEAVLGGQGESDLGPRTAARQEAFRRQKTAEAPRTIGSAPPRAARPELSEPARMIAEARGWTRAAIVDAPERPNQELRGQGVSRGIYRGPARVVRGVEELGRVRAGDVLVCPLTSPTWTSVFALIGALVADEGSMLSHPAILAREHGIPAVLATGTLGGRKATETIADGAIVEVDGTAGVVRWGDL